MRTRKMRCSQRGYSTEKEAGKALVKLDKPGYVIKCPTCQKYHVLVVTLGPII